MNDGAGTRAVIEREQNVVTIDATSNRVNSLTVKSMLRSNFVRQLADELGYVRWIDRLPRFRQISERHVLYA
jgi:hypothetical protein